MADRAASDILIASTILQLILRFEDGVTYYSNLSLIDAICHGVKVIGSSD